MKVNRKNKSRRWYFLKQITCAIALLISGSAFAQGDEPLVGIDGDNLSEELREIRTNQLEVANANGVQLNIFHRGI